jgi:hypothetical protein
MQRAPGAIHHRVSSTWKGIYPFPTPPTPQKISCCKKRRRHARAKILFCARVLFGNTHTHTRALVFRNSHDARSIGIGMSRRSPRARVHRARDFFEPLVDKFISRRCPDLFIAPKLSRCPSDQPTASGERKFTSSLPSGALLFEFA